MRFVTLTWLSLLMLIAARSAVDSAEEAKDKKAKDKAAASEVVINIVNPGTDAKYIKDGDDEQKPVTVTVGQTVAWRNMGDRKHTATSVMKVDDKPVFDTDQIKKTESAKVVFDEALYTKAGGKPGGEVALDYFCANHPHQMKSKIILKSPKAKKRR